MSWDDDQHGESEWWGQCLLTYGEETKQLTYAKRMGLQVQEIDGQYPVIDLQGKSVLDLGGGPVSLLLKTINSGKTRVVDPCKYPDWVMERYAYAGIAYSNEPAEDFDTAFEYDEVWIYNVLQHTKDPKKIIENAMSQGNLVRIFEWVDIPAHPGHPHELRAADLSQWLGGPGQVEDINEYPAVGRAFYGMFPTSVAAGIA